MTTTALVYDDIFLEHKVPAGFPESPQRLTAILDRLKRHGLLDRLVQVAPREAEMEWLEQVHAPRYIERAKYACLRNDAQLDCEDMPISARSYEVAVVAAGGVLAAVDAVMAGTAGNVFCAVRPPGHHAMRDRAMGFCMFNNVAIAARYVQQRHKLARVLIVDWDVHHGNGTQAAFYDDPTVLYFSTHQWPHYPGSGVEAESGRDKGDGFTLNVPLPEGATDADYLRAFREKLLPAADAFAPDFVLISAGFDAHASDPLGGMKLTSAVFGELTRLVRGIAGRHAKGRIVSVLEGGYDLDALAESVEFHVTALKRL